ncbi:MAG: spore germination protein [Clostridia bacterium]|nr:spore germination protein [Clostridia bacterium]
MNNILEYIKSRCESLDDVYFRQLEIEGEKIYLVSSDAMTDSNLLSNFVIRSIIECIKNSDKKEEIDINNLEQKILKRLKIEKRKIDFEDVLSISKIKKLDINSEDVFKYIFSGFAIIIYNELFYAVEVKASLTRSISEPSSENSVRGAKDSFVENIIKNVGLIRNRIKSEELAYKEQEVGRKTKTKVALMYMKDIAKNELVKYVENKIEQIDIDGILDVNYIQEFIEEENDSDFPVSINTQRPDIVSYYLLQGRIVILVDNSPFVLILPAFFEDFINNVDDLYQKSKNVTLTKIVRYISLAITIMTPALYLAIITFNQESIPSQLLRSFTAQREGVPFPAFLEALIMIFAFEILKESDLRANKVTGNTLSIVGALILGDAAVSAGIVSPIMIIVVAITTISGLMFSDINMINALRKWRIVFMLSSSLCGIIGIGIASILLIASLVDTKSYTKPFTYPIAPFNFTEAKKNILNRINISKDKNRQKILTNNLTKSR